MTNIEYMGCEYVEPCDYIFDVPIGKYYLILITHTPAVFWVDGKITEYPGKCGIMFHPHQKVLYGASGGKFINDWICFSSNDAGITAANLPRGVPFPLRETDYCSKLVQLIFYENCLSGGGNSYKDLSINNLMMTLLNKFMESFISRPVSVHYQKLIELRARIIGNANEDWSVNKMADLLNISPGYLQTLYKNTFGVSCMDDVINNRIRMAKEYLLSKAGSASEAAFFCGYRSAEHFYRQFKSITGYTPKEFVKKVYEV